MPAPDQPTASDREADLQRICEEVGNAMPGFAGWRGVNPQPFDNFAKEVARRYAATVGAGGWREITDADKARAKTRLIIAKYPGCRAGWSDPYSAWWSNMQQKWLRWPHDFPPTHCMDVGNPPPEQA